MRKILIATLVSIAALSAASMASAAGKAGGGPSNGMHEAAANSNGMKSTDRDFGKDRAEDRASSKSQAALNSNGIHAADRDKGKARAEDRHHRIHRRTHHRK